jgi:hypothetical protein
MIGPRESATGSASSCPAAPAAAPSIAIAAAMPIAGRAHLMEM